MPDTVIDHDFGKEFTISTWMRHEARMELKHRKEQILCLADDHRKSRHHTSLFIRNCKLVLLLRRGYEETERNVFKPAEWRWTLPQVCDDRWHHYAISVSAGGAELWLDGEQWQAETHQVQHHQPTLLHHYQAAAPSLVQHADGRYFAVNAHLQPGQLFQAADGRLFTLATSSLQEVSQAVQEQQEEEKGEAGGVLAVGRTLEAEANKPDLIPLTSNSLNSQPDNKILNGL